MINIEDFQKVELRIAEVKEINKNKIMINYNNKIYPSNLNLKIEKRDKIVIIIDNDKVIIPVVNNNIPIIPEEDIELGSKVR